MYRGGRYMTDQTVPTCLGPMEPKHIFRILLNTLGYMGRNLESGVRTELGLNINYCMHKRHGLG